MNGKTKDLGVEVVDERPYGIERPEGERDWIYDFGLRYEGREPIDASDPEDLQRRFQEAFKEAFKEEMAALAEAEYRRRLDDGSENSRSWRESLP